MFSDRLYVYSFHHHFIIIIFYISSSYLLLLLFPSPFLTSSPPPLLFYVHFFFVTSSPCQDADTFDPSTVPTLDQLLREVNDAAKKAVVSTTDAGSASSTSALAFTADKTSLRQYIEFFSSFVSDLLTDERAKGKRVDADMY